MGVQFREHENNYKKTIGITTENHSLISVAYREQLLSKERREKKLT